MGLIVRTFFLIQVTCEQHRGWGTPMPSKICIYLLIPPKLNYSHPSAPAGGGFPDPRACPNPWMLKSSTYSGAEQFIQPVLGIRGFPGADQKTFEHTTQ